MRLIRPLFLTLLATLLIYDVAAPQEPLTGSWSAQFREEKVHLNLSLEAGPGRGFSNWGRTWALSEFSEMVRPMQGRGDMSFELRREAGTFVFGGRGDAASGSGWFELRPSAAYVRELARMGFGDLQPKDLFVLAVSGLRVADVRRFEELTSDDLTTATLVRMLNHGVSIEFAQGLADLGFTGLSASQLTRTRDHGVTPRYIARCAATAST